MRDRNGDLQGTETAEIMEVAIFREARPELCCLKSLVAQMEYAQVVLLSMECCSIKQVSGGEVDQLGTNLPDENRKVFKILTTQLQT